MHPRIERAIEAGNSALNTLETSRKWLIAEGIGTVAGLGGGLILSLESEQLIPTVILGAIGFTSGAAFLSNLDYQGVVGWSEQPPDKLEA